MLILLNGCVSRPLPTGAGLLVMGSVDADLLVVQSEEVGVTHENLHTEGAVTAPTPRWGAGVVPS
jgi:hypothetical protein